MKDILEIIFGCYSLIITIKFITLKSDFEWSEWHRKSWENSALSKQRVIDKQEIQLKILKRK